MSGGEVRIAGHVTTNTAGAMVHGDTRVGDPGVFVPDLQLGGSLYVAVSDSVQLGAQVSYAHLSWAHPNVVGVLDFPDGSDEHVLFGGAGVRVDLLEPFGRFQVSLIGELNLGDVPQAVYLCSTCDGDTHHVSTSEARDLYRFFRYDSEMFMLPNVAVQASWNVTPELQIYGLLGAQANVTNIGFDDDLSRLNDTTLETFLLGYVGLGIELRVEAFVVNATFFLPLEGEDRIDFGPSLAA